MILRNEASGAEFTVPEDGARLGRDPTLEIVFPEGDDVVSGLHCRIVRRADGSWWLEDLGSTNGTWCKSHRLTEPLHLLSGTTFSLGQRGPVMRVTIPGQVAPTQQEMVVKLPDGVPHLRLRRVKGGEDLTATGKEIVIGRSAGCQIPLRTVADTVVSKRHVRIAFGEDGRATLEDLGSRNGTYLNGNPVQGQARLKLGDRLMLGWQGPMFEIRVLGGASMPDGEGAPYEPAREPRKSIPGMVAAAQDEARAAAPQDKAATGVFMKSMARQLVTESSPSFRLAVAAAFVVLLGAMAVVWRQSAQRTAEAEARLATAEHAITEQLRRADSAQQTSAARLDSMRRDLEEARRNAVNRTVLDSLERRLQEAEARALTNDTTRPPALPGATHDFTDVARENRRAIGLVIVRFAGDSGMGTGFAITPSGYFVTARHVVQEDDRGAARQVAVVMAESNTVLAADVVSVSTVQTQDVAVLKVRNYRGPMVRSIDWQGSGAQMGAPAVMIGFPFGTAAALDAGGYVHPSLFGGYISQTGDWIRFSGNTFVGVSGSPVFNANGDVIAVHFGEPVGGHGLGVSVPMSRVRRWLPADARAELGL